MAHNRKLAVWATFLHFKNHKPYQGTLGTLEVIIIGSRTRPGPYVDPTGTIKLTKMDLRMEFDSRDTRSDNHRLQDPTWSFNGPYRDPKMDQMIFEKIPGFVHLLYIVHSAAPLNILENFFWSLWNSTRAQGTLLDCHGPSWTPK